MAPRRVARATLGDDGATHHELRNHLTVILGFTELLQLRVPAASPWRADLDAIHDAAASALRVLDQERAGRERTGT